MFNVLIDTNVWLDLAENQRLTPLLSVLQYLLEETQMALLVPDIVLDEFRANRDRVAARSVKSLSSHFNLVKEAVRNAPDDEQKHKVISYLSDLDHRIPIVGAAAKATLDTIEGMLVNGAILNTSSAAKIKAAERALRRKAPFHHDGKNSMADALIIETYFEAVERSKPRERFAFVTHNKADFSLQQATRSCRIRTWPTGSPRSSRCTLLRSLTASARSTRSRFNPTCSGTWDTERSRVHCLRSSRRWTS